MHASAVRRLADHQRAMVAEAAKLVPFEWSVARVGPGRAIGLLRYPGFIEEAFPVLTMAANVNLETGQVRVTNYERSTNPLILHRKELLVGEDHPMRAQWARLTRRLEDLGLFTNLNTIGRQRAWSEALASAALKLDDLR